MERRGKVDKASAKVLRDCLMAEADAEDRLRINEGIEDLEHCWKLARQPGAWGEDDLIERCDFLELDPVMWHDRTGGARCFANKLHEIVRERIVIIDEKNADQLQ